MLAAFARAHRARHHCRKFAGRIDGLQLPPFNDGSCDASGEAFLSEAADHVADLVAVGAGEPGGCALTALRVHAHVERTVVLETETAGGFIKLR